MPFGIPIRPNRIATLANCISALNLNCHRLGAGERRWIEVEAEITRTQGNHSHHSAQQHLQQAHNVLSHSVQPSSSLQSDGSVGGGVPRTGSSNSQRSDTQQQHDSTDGPRRA